MNSLGAVCECSLQHLVARARTLLQRAARAPAAIHPAMQWVQCSAVLALLARCSAAAVKDQGLCDHLKILFPRNAVGDIWHGRQFRRQQRARSATYPTKSELREKLYYDADPYLNLTIFPKKFFRWINWYPSSAAKHRRQIWSKVNETLGMEPRLIVEIGSFLGTSAVETWGPLAKRSSAEAMVLCVDTWYGDVSMRLRHTQEKRSRPIFRDSLRMQHGIPSTSRTFMDRIVAFNLTEFVFPLAMGSITAARLLAVVNWRMDVVYIDSAHEKGETLVELHMYYQLLRPGGLMMGDDIDIFPAVKQDVMTFAACHGLTVERFAGNLWLMRKPDERESEKVSR